MSCLIATVATQILFAQTTAKVTKLSPLKTISSVGKFRASKTYASYELRKSKGWKLRTGEYNQQYKSRFSNAVVEIQSLGNRITGMDVIFYKRPKLRSVEKGFIFALIQLASGNKKLGAETKQQIVSNIESDVMSLNDNDEILFDDLVIKAGNTGGHTVVIKPSDNL